MNTSNPTKPSLKSMLSTPILTSKEKQTFKDPLWDNNPITLQILGICSALAVTTQVSVALVMCIAVVAVLTCSNIIVSLIRDWIPNNIRIIVMLIVVSSLVILVDQTLKAYFFDLSKQLSVFVGLIITNCIILGRAEGFASKNSVFASFLDGLGNSLGYSAVLLIVATFREVLGNGTFFNIPVVPQFLYDIGYTNIGLMILPPGAFIILGLLIWVQRSISKAYEKN